MILKSAFAATVLGLALAAPAHARGPALVLTADLPVSAVCTPIVIEGRTAGYRCTHNGNTWQCTSPRRGCTLETATITAPAGAALVRSPRAFAVSRR